MVVNKIDRPDQRIHEVVDEVLELLMDLDATAEQLDSPMLFCSGRQRHRLLLPRRGRAPTSSRSLRPFWSISPPRRRMRTQPFQMLVSSIDYNEFVGRIAIGRIERGTLKQNQEIAVCNYHDPDAARQEGQGHCHLRV